MNTPIKLTTEVECQITNGISITKTPGWFAISRDFDSQTPFFYAIIENCLHWNSHYPSLVLQLQEMGYELSLNKKYLWDYLAYQAPLSPQTLINPINFLRAGETHEIKNRDFQLQAIKFSSKKGDNSTEQAISSREFESRLCSSLVGLNKDKTAFHISSGLDSSLLAILATQIKGKGINLATCQTLGKGSNDELQSVKQIANDLEAKLKIYDFTELEVFSVGKSLIKCIGYPLAHPSHVLEYALDQALVLDGFDTIVNGKGPDDCLAGYATHLPEFANSQKHKERLTVTETQILKNLLGKNIESGVEFWERAPKTLSLRDRLYYDARALTDSWNHIHHSFAKGLKCQIVSPFMDPSIRSGLFALPDKEKIKDGKQKYFLRKTFSQAYPEYIINLPKSAFRLDLKPYFSKYSAQELTSQLTQECEVLLQAVDINEIKRLINQTLADKCNYGWQLWGLYLTALSCNTFKLNKIS